LIREFFEADKKNFVAYLMNQIDNNSSHQQKVIIKDLLRDKLRLELKYREVLSSQV
jgi:hypothetical protein